MSKLHEGGCHCGAIRYRAQVPDPLVGGRCNCSICAMKGVVMVRVPLDAIEVTQGEDNLRCYSFHTLVAKHWFCATCGIHLYHQARADPNLYGINAATLDGVCPYADFPEVVVSDGQRHAMDNGGTHGVAGWLRYAPTPE